MHHSMNQQRPLASSADKNVHKSGSKTRLSSAVLCRGGRGLSRHIDRVVPRDSVCHRTRARRDLRLCSVRLSSLCLLPAYFLIPPCSLSYFLSFFLLSPFYLLRERTSEQVVGEGRRKTVTTTAPRQAASAHFQRTLLNVVAQLYNPWNFPLGELSRDLRARHFCGGRPWSLSPRFREFLLTSALLMCVNTSANAVCLKLEARQKIWGKLESSALRDLGSPIK